MKANYRLFFFFILIFIAEIATAKEVSYRGRITVTPASEKHFPIVVAENAPVAGTLDIPVAFNELSFDCPSYGDNIGELTLSLYRWKKDYRTTTAGKVLVTQTFRDFADNETLVCTFPELKPGRYLWVLHSPRQHVGIWSVADSIKGVTTFINGVPRTGACQVGYGFTASAPFCGTYENYLKYRNKKNTAPKEPVLSANDPIEKFDVRPDTWYATDELGRVLPDAKECGPVRSGKQVGIFYWTWHKYQAEMGKGKIGPHDNTKIIAEHPDALGNIKHPAWGPIYHPHHWSEPLFGYYTTVDQWVLRRHAELLANAMIDVVIFDATNGTRTWMDSTFALLKAFAEARADGVRTPKIAFMLPFRNLKYNRIDLIQLYRDIYRDGKYQDLWFYWQGKPLIYGIPESIEEAIPTATPEEKSELEAILGFFTFRPGQPVYTGGPRRPDDWSWLEIYPQNGYVPRSDGTFEMISVGVAQNHSSNTYRGKSGLAAMNDRNVFGRAHVVGQEKDSRPNAFLYGGNFQQQWSRAFELDPDFVFVTGWNEWIASRFPKWMDLENAFPDQYNTEFSRDIEPSRGILRDNYYMQLVANVRRFKGVHAVPAASGPRTIDLSRKNEIGKEDIWSDVLPVYRDYKGDIGIRDAAGYGRTHYKNTTGRNDIILAKVARNEEKVYFMVETDRKLTDEKDRAWMRLFLSIRPMNMETPSWETFQYVINREKPGVLEQSRGGWNWEKIGEVEYRITDRRLEIAIPRKLLKISSNCPLDIHFKWSDNMQQDGEPLDFYENGDTAPDARFTWRYVE